MTGTTTHEGVNYDPALDVKDVAKRVRQRISEWKARGLFPKNWRVSVKIQRASMLNALDVRILAPADAWLPADENGWVRPGPNLAAYIDSVDRMARTWQRQESGDDYTNNNFWVDVQGRQA